MTAETARQGRVVAAHGRHYRVQLESGELRHCYTRGKKAGPAVGDQVRILPEGRDEGVITEILPRRNLLYRSDASKSKQFAANLDQLLLIVAAEPEFSADLMGRALVAAGSVDIPVRIVLNKTDLPSIDSARSRLRPIAELGIPIVELCALDAAQTQARLGDWLQGRSTLLLGQSGMGKSTLLNALVPQARAATQAHSEALGTGRHTTTQTRLYDLPGGGDLIDSPGFQAFGLQHLTQHEIEQGFPEFTPAIPHCRFYNCTHLHEPGCGVLAAMARGEITAERHALYQRILAENDAARKW
ncbi:MAG: ribosome small subunit-dependent GTPase A [Castellaniella sp.]|uniref:ribosome small subunit-dependent GTPase A n=1 Tax=Castellaniella sp. TaxID=1955812 RepID=UPI0012113F70|nr:ribosome small subunit-dependent GTPase A [Castellaniella sp.]TAN26095.1 MAG: ribosome small subunit-dependent GTPase A [Castellaniella sp.]